MGTDPGQQPERLAHAPFGHERLVHLERSSFFTLLRFLEANEPFAARQGGDGPIAAEAIRLRHSPDLVFSAGEIERVTRVPVPIDEQPTGRTKTIPGHISATPRESRLEIVSTMLGLTGGVSPLPTFMAEEIALLESRDDPQIAFLDLFHHRLLGLLYRGVTKHELAHELDKRISSSQGSWIDRLLGLCGIDRTGGQTLHFLDWRRVLRIAPLLVTRSRTPTLVAQALEVLLGEYLNGATCTIYEYQGGWTSIDPTGQIRLNTTRLGRTTGLGSRAFTPSAAVRISLRCLDEAGYSEFLRGQPAYLALCEGLNLLLDDPLDFELELVVRSNQRGSAILGRSKLSRDAWLGHVPKDERKVRFTGTPRDLEAALAAAPGMNSGEKTVRGA